MQSRRYVLLLLTLTALPLSGRAADIDDLLMAAEMDDGRSVLKLLLRGVDPNALDARGRQALATAMKEDSERAFDALLSHPGLEIKARNAKGETPLMLAAIKGRLDWVKKLVAKGAEINQSGWTPLHYACSGPDNGVAQWLISQGADIEARAPNGTTPLMMAAGYGALDLTPLLIKAGALLTPRNAQGLSAEDFARRAGRERPQKQLAEAAAR
ncbi:ankyrin repeat protein [Paucibacter oligotrophus]|uniref:Ankyrin repeat protein n=1 Tax=Roseateles oligotrophus TaxID=1769250 RepID=A0A840LG37_9BURK|nr:ankyrin repeat domain-containing protein [Roseateles oligotrophus]MBB4844257.1 ankyrin repeat protein [Roseateles oligotrophus]